MGMSTSTSAIFIMFSIDLSARTTIHVASAIC